MKLNILERLMLLNVLPPEGDLRTMRIVHDLRMALALSQQEMTDWGVENQVDEAGKPTGVIWDDAKVQDAEIDVAGEKTALIVEALKKLDSEKKLTAQHLSLCEKFPFGDKKG
jgi:hypothetical protein